MLALGRKAHAADEAPRGVAAERRRGAPRDRGRAPAPRVSAGFLSGYSARGAITGGGFWPFAHRVARDRGETAAAPTSAATAAIRLRARRIRNGYERTPRAGPRDPSRAGNEPPRTSDHPRRMPQILVVADTLGEHGADARVGPPGSSTTSTTRRSCSSASAGPPRTQRRSSAVAPIRAPLDRLARIESNVAR